MSTIRALSQAHKAFCARGGTILWDNLLPMLNGMQHYNTMDSTFYDHTHFFFGHARWQPRIEAY